MVIIRHVHLRGLTPFRRAGQIQDGLVRRMLDSKSRPRRSDGRPADLPDKIPTTILTFESLPTYTCGLRDADRLTKAEIDKLTQSADGTRLAEFVPTNRGGQITFHGPGQVVAYVIGDLNVMNKYSDINSRLGPRDYVCMLEQSIIDTCQQFGVTSERGGDGKTGVWVRKTRVGVDDRLGREDVGDGRLKIAAIGVHLRRFVSSHGIGLNVHTDMKMFGRVVACGMDGRMTTSLSIERKRGKYPNVEEVNGGSLSSDHLSVENVAVGLVGRLTARLFGPDGQVDRVDLED